VLRRRSVAVEAERRPTAWLKTGPWFIASMADAHRPKASSPRKRAPVVRLRPDDEDGPPLNAMAAA
jgi:hypothetical protein